jgi:hypothetical protein
MPHNLAAALQAVADQIGIVFGCKRIHSHGRRDTILLQHIQDAENADTMAVLPVRQEGVIRIGPWRHTTCQDGAKAIRGGQPLRVLQVDHDTQRQARLLRPAQHATRGDRRPVVVRMIHAETTFCWHCRVSPSSWR